MRTKRAVTRKGDEHARPSNDAQGKEQAPDDRDKRQKKTLAPEAWFSLLLLRLRRESRAHERDRRLDVSRHERRIDPDDTVTRANQHRITARIGASLLGVVPAIDLDHEPLSGR